MKLHPVKGKVRLRDEDARVDSPFASKDAMDEATAHELGRIDDLQRVFYADGRHALLVVLQGRDASGKDGTIRKVFSAANPQGCRVSSFVAPTALEQKHDFLWRVHAQVPPRGMIGIFNRSHYEDVIVPRVHATISKRVCAERLEQINDFERMLAQNGVVILKFMLHVSRDEQKRRFLERLTDARKSWKFAAADLDDRQRWGDFTKAYRALLTHTSTEWAPWYVVHADDKPLRNWLVAQRVAETLDGLGLRYPPPDPALASVEVE
jgi:PPK2 family polyphosphate:nucleotide phosphotransferase